jgi:hypothetical protein
MKLIAHRGWSCGPEENTLAALRRSVERADVSGVELDVRRSGRGALVLSHDEPPEDVELPTLHEAARVLAGTNRDLLLELKETGLQGEVVRILQAADVAPRTILFGFPEIVRDLDWSRPRAVKLGVIAPYPWQIRRLFRRYEPDAILLGWDRRAWTRIGFRAWWSVFSLPALARRSSSKIIVGVARTTSDLQWLCRQEIEAAVADMEAL